ncbi:hypothetical protein EVAR_62907_1 [Eumeta japonica]|uniref:Uncharacterized protein n=1 Tax=Eumeta variegata TaxID=151549 RepID=A0A4C1Y610_EUMVA|nr:hypothetical protein EVAR_62907_1 [Eumeta japonica]
MLLSKLGPRTFSDYGPLFRIELSNTYAGVAAFRDLRLPIFLRRCHFLSGVHTLEGVESEFGISNLPTIMFLEFTGQESIFIYRKSDGVLSRMLTKSEVAVMSPLRATYSSI